MIEKQSIGRTSRVMLQPCLILPLVNAKKLTAQRKGFWMRTSIDVFLALIVLCAGGFVGAALLGVLP